MALYDIQGKKVIVVGLARSGVAAALLLAADGAKVVANDLRSEEEIGQETIKKLSSPLITLAAGSQSADLVDKDTALVVKSPGVPQSVPLLQRAREMKIPVISEVELAYEKLKEALIVGITGTNGKTTTTALTGEMFKTAGRNTYVAGNIGLPLAEVAPQVSSGDVVVAELSSFQLEDICFFRAHISAVLNITPDHIDRHGTMEAYTEAKTRLLRGQTPQDAAVINADDDNALVMEKNTAACTYYFSCKKEVPAGAFVREGKVILRTGGRDETVCSVTDILIPGAHNLENALAASLMAKLGGVNPRYIAGVLKSFPGVPHRLEHVRTVRGVKFINDSKGTNSDAAIKALEAFASPKVLIAGGYDKGTAFDRLARAISAHASFVVLIGQVRDQLAAALQAEGFTAFVFAKTLENAVHKAYKEAPPGGVVLFSPACASWDMFEDYIERGEYFKKAVQSLEE